MQPWQSTANNKNIVVQYQRIKWNHPHILGTYTPIKVQTPDGQSFVLLPMQIASGDSSDLFDFVKRTGPLGSESRRLRELMLQVAHGESPFSAQLCTNMHTQGRVAARHTLRELPLFAALAFCHHNGVAHRDVKPENVLLLPPDDGPTPPPGGGATHSSSDGSSTGGFIAKLCDFGSAKLSETMKPVDANYSSGPTPLVPGSSPCGSPMYAAPEVAKLVSASDARNRVPQPGPPHSTVFNVYDTCSADVWSFAVMIHVMATGRALWHRAVEDDPRFVAFAKYVAAQHEAPNMPGGLLSVEARGGPVVDGGAPLRQSTANARLANSGHTRTHSATSTPNGVGHDMVGTPFRHCAMSDGSVVSGGGASYLWNGDKGPAAPHQGGPASVYGHGGASRGGSSGSTSAGGGVSGFGAAAGSPGADAEPPWTWGPDVCPCLRDLLERCLRLDPLERLPMFHILQHPWFTHPTWDPPSPRSTARQQYEAGIRRMKTPEQETPSSSQSSAELVVMVHGGTPPQYSPVEGGGGNPSPPEQLQQVAVSAQQSLQAAHTSQGYQHQHAMQDRMHSTSTYGSRNSAGTGHSGVLGGAGGVIPGEGGLMPSASSSQGSIWGGAEGGVQPVSGATGRTLSAQERHLGGIQEGGSRSNGGGLVLGDGWSAPLVDFGHSSAHGSLGGSVDSDGGAHAMSPPPDRDSVISFGWGADALPALPAATAGRDVMYVPTPALPGSSLAPAPLRSMGSQYGSTVLWGGGSLGGGQSPGGGSLGSNSDFGGNVNGLQLHVDGGAVAAEGAAQGFGGFIVGGGVNLPDFGSSGSSDSGDFDAWHSPRKNEGGAVPATVGGWRVTSQ